MILFIVFQGIWCFPLRGCKPETQAEDFFFCFCQRFAGEVEDLWDILYQWSPRGGGLFFLHVHVLWPVTLVFRL